jgi:hypothetical protein
VNEKAKTTLVFGVDSAEIIEDNPDSRFITCRIHVFSSGKNYHNLFCSEDTLKKTASTIYNMPIIYNLVDGGRDFGSHISPEKSLICGFAIPDTGVFEKLVNDNGEEVLGFYVDAKIWRIYVPAVSEILEKRDGKVGISVEMWLYESHIREDNAIEEMDDFCYFGICLLGSSVKSAIQNAELQVLSFSQINEKYQEDYIKEFSKYSSLDFSISEEIRDNSTQGLSLYKKHGLGGNSVALTIARHLSKNEKAQPEKVKSVYKYLQYHQNDTRKKSPPNSAHIGYLLYGGTEAYMWSKDLVEKMKEIEDKPMSYFEEGEVITFPYKKISEAPENIKKLDGVSLTLRQLNEISAQADAIGGENAWPTAIKSWKSRHEVVDNKWVKKEKKVKEDMNVRVNKTNANKEAEVKFSLTSSQITEILNNALSEVKYGEDQWRRYWVYNFDSEFAYFHDNEMSKDFRAKYSIEGVIAAVDIEGKEEVIEGCPMPVEAKEYTPVFADEDEPEDDAEDKPKDVDMADDKSADDKPKEDEVEDPKDKPDESEDKPSEDDKPKEDEKPKEKDMSLDANLDLAALLQMLVEETEDNKELADKYEAGEEMDYALLCSKLFAKVKKMKEESDAAKEDKDVYMAENASLKEYKDKIEKQQFDYAVEKTLQEVSDVFSKDEIDAAREEVKEFSVENLPAWQNDIKGKAFSRIKDNPKKKENFTRMATVSSWLNRDNESSEDVSKKYAKEGWLPKN